jgi:hypothetical protein
MGNDNAMNGGNHINYKHYNIVDIVALEPCYGIDGGNATRIHDRHGRVTTESCRMITLLQRTARYYGVDLVRLRKNCSDHLGCGQSVPLPFAPYLVLVPLKMRLPEFVKDSATGYVNLKTVIDVTAADDYRDKKKPKCYVNCVGGSSLPSFISLKATEKKLKHGMLIRDYFCALQHHKADQSQLMVMEKAKHDALDTLVSINRILYELLTENDLDRAERLKKIMTLYDN